jgi:hypothetical protein
MLTIGLNRYTKLYDRSIMDYCMKSTLESIKKNTEKYNLEKEKEKIKVKIELDDNNKNPNLNYYKLLLFLSVSSLGFYFYKKIK